MFTFTNGLYGKVINTFPERVQLFAQADADFVLYAEFNGEFAAMSADGFLHELTRNDVKGIICGFDYRFGKGATGDTALLERFCAERRIAFQVQPEFCIGGKKVSTTLIKELLAQGDMGSAKQFLGREYFLEGYVTVGHGVGKRLGFPTANIEVEAEKLLPKCGVYGGTAEFDGITKKCVINVGARPTFNDEQPAVEAHLLDFDGDLYLKKIRLAFDTYLRPVEKFDTEQELVEQISSDIRRVL